MMVIVCENVVRAVAGTKDAIDLGMRECLAIDLARVRIDQSANPDWSDDEAILPLDQALQVLEEKLSFLVEDERNDWNFVRGMMLQSQRERLQNYVDMGWAEPVHGGGTGIRARLEARLGKPHKLLRTVMIFDSDRLHPDELKEDWNPEQSGIKEHECPAFDWERFAKKTLGSRYWRLKRRFIESYMPISELEIAAGAQNKMDAFNAFCTMSEVCRWHYNMKGGFAKDATHQQRHLDLYSAVKEDEKRALDNGFGKKLAAHYEHALEREFNWDDDAREEARLNLPRLLRLL